MQDSGNNVDIGDPTAAEAGNVPSAESVTAKIEACEARKRVKKAARAAQGKTPIGDSSSLYIAPHDLQ